MTSAAEIETAEPLAYDSYSDNRATGGFILVDRMSNLTVAAGLIENGLATDHGDAGLDEAERAALFLHHPALIDLSAQPALAPALEKNLLLRHAHAVIVEDADTPVEFLLRSGLIVISTTPRPEATLGVEPSAARTAEAVAAIVEALRNQGLFDVAEFNQGEGI